MMQPFTCYLVTIWAQDNGLANSTYSYEGMQFRGLRVPEVRIIEEGFILRNPWNPTLGSKQKMFIMTLEPS